MFTAGTKDCELSYNFNVCLQKADPKVSFITSNIVNRVNIFNLFFTALVPALILKQGKNFISIELGFILCIQIL